MHRRKLPHSHEPIFDEAIHYSGVKVVQVHQIVARYRDFRRHGKAQNTTASWVFAFTIHILTATNWLVTLISPRLIIT